FDSRDRHRVAAGPPLPDHSPDLVRGGERHVFGVVSKKTDPVQRREPQRAGSVGVGGWDGRFLGY
ncbi:MAG: hypothetical protein ACLQVF_42740, partial [Isosphaeraceae bacterium]